MADNKIRVYQNNNKTVICTVSNLDITGYTPYLTAKKNNAAENTAEIAFPECSGCI